MNQIHRIIWNAATACYQAVAETGKAQGKGSAGKVARSARRAALVATLAGLGSLGSLGSTAWAQSVLPTGGVVVAGSGTIAQAGTVMTVTQTTAKMAADWQSFNIGAGNSVNFVQPSASSVALNRVLGSDVSLIQGALNANGQVFLVNPNGVLFTPTAQVNVGSIVASTLAISTADFMAGSYKFAGDSSNAIINQGNITTINGGSIALIAAKITNTGTLTANAGNVLLGAGSQVTLDLGGPVKLQVTQAAIDTLIENGGAIKADGGLVYLTAKAAGDLATSVINNTGVIEAHTLATGEKGQIMLMGDMQVGTVNVGGTLDASAPNGGNGGFIETSAAHVKIDPNVKITTASAQGLTGTWLIDPVDFTIAATGGDITGGALGTLLASNSITIQTATSPTATSTNLIGTTGSNGDIFVNEAVSWSANNTLTLNAFRNITINQSITSTGATGKLSLLYGQGAVAAGNTASYNVNAPVNLVAGANFSTKLGSDGALKNYTVITSLGAAGSTTGTDLQGMSGGLATNYALGSNIDDAGLTSTWNSGAGFAPVGTGATKFTGTFDGLGHTISNLTIYRPTTNSVGLFGSVDSGTVKNVGLVGGSVTGDSRVGGLVGYNDGGSISNSYATGEVTGTGDGDDVGGLVGKNYGSISNSYATGAVTGTGDDVGGLVGENYNRSSSISNSYATGAVEGYNNVGGLVGYFFRGTISNSYATGEVEGTGDDVGGLVGYSSGGDISNSYATGAVTGSNEVGGLVGFSSGDISNSYATGAVTGSNDVGGLVGEDDGDISNSYWNNSVNTVGIGRNSNGSVTTGLSTTQMQDKANTSTNFVGFTFASAAGTVESTWGFSAGGGYPVLCVFGTCSFTTNAYLRLIAGSSFYGNTPSFSYALYDASSAGTLISDASPSGTVTWSTPLSATSNVGSYNVSYASGLTLGNAGYILNAGSAANWIISQRPITLTADAKTKVFGNSDPALTYQVTTGNLVGSDVLTGVLTRTGGENVGSYSINANALANGNYLITATDGTLSIERNPVLDNAVRVAQQQVSTGTNAVAAGSSANVTWRTMPSAAQSAGFGPLSSQTTGSTSSNVSQSGGMVFVQVPDSAANTPTETGSSEDVALATLPSSGGTDTAGFVRVIVVNGGINLGPYSVTPAR